ncbi:MAG: glycosyltransferase family 2 protein [Paludibacteraceae bacterium]|nr:glycosyltransferase family 2 protein [Paludibacteraceae bacterium]
MSKLLSIVIPVYKVEPYINKCLDSLLLYKEDGSINDELMSMLDILIVNDGTPDQSAEMSREYVNRYPKYFRQIDKENGGHGSVWNMGVMEAKGKYLKFLDSDDWLQNLDKFVEKLQFTDSDLILTPTRCHCANNEIWKQKILGMEFYHPYDADTFDWLGNPTHNYLLHHCCCYKTTIFRQYMPGLFLEKQPYDDVVLWPAAMIGAKTIEAFDFPLYNYLMDRPGQSISIEVQKKNLGASIKSQKHTIEFYEKHPALVGTTKEQYIRHRLPRSYNTYYRQSIDFPYPVGKNLVKEWDEWVRATNPHMKTIWITMYRSMPYCMYYITCKCLQLLISIKVKLNPNKEAYSAD